LLEDGYDGIRVAEKTGLSNMKVLTFDGFVSRETAEAVYF
jgi:hypothetical protein